MIDCGARREPADILSSRLEIVCGNVMVLLMACPPMRFDVLDFTPKRPESGIKGVQELSEFMRSD